MTENFSLWQSLSIENDGKTPAPSRKLALAGTLIMTIFNNDNNDN